MAHRDDTPSIAEIAALTARLRHLRSPDATEAERAAFLAEKDALIARIDAANRRPDDHDQRGDQHADVTDDAGNDDGDEWSR